MLHRHSPPISKRAAGVLVALAALALLAVAVLGARAPGAEASTRPAAAGHTETAAAHAARRSRCRTRSGHRRRSGRCAVRHRRRHRPRHHSHPNIPVDPGPGPTGPTADEQGFVPRVESQDMTEYDTGNLGGGAYDNATIADIGLSHLGQNLYTPGPLDHGQCKQAANDWVAQASHNTQRLGGDYNTNYARNGGQQVGRDDVAKGDIIQLFNPADERGYYRGMHTAVIVSHAAGSNSFDVVDSNYGAPDVVSRHAWDPFASAQKYGLRIAIWRMGTVTAPVQQPVVQPPPQPAPQPTGKNETTGGVSHTWTNYTNAGGTEGPVIGANQTVYIACKLPGFRVADGNTWWYRIGAAPWNGQYYVSADAFYNNGATSGSLHGTPFVDPAVPDC